MAITHSLDKQASYGETLRQDFWWIQPIAVFCGLSAFILYSTWAAFQGNHYHFGPYLSPFYSPEIFGDSPHSWFGPKPSLFPQWAPWSPAFLILWIPASFRLTCYYYRGAYYKAFWADPPNCAVGEPRKSYLGEQTLPLILQNLHRYFFYLAAIFILFLFHDAWTALWFTNPATGLKTFGIGVGTLVLTINAILLGGYTFGCHCFRHFAGGSLDEISKKPIRHKVYEGASCLNRRHMLWAWMSLCWVGFSDIYIRLCSMGIWTDWRLF